MTDERCEPPPELRGKDGWHWVENTVHPGLCPAFWGRTMWARGTIPTWPENAADLGWVYLSPVLTPAEVEALRAERDAAVAEVARMKAEQERYDTPAWEANERLNGVVDQQHAELTTLRAEVERLRAALGSIARNTCCDGCQEAARWARAALEPKP